MTREWKLLCEANGYCFLTGKIENKFCVIFYKRVCVAV